MNAVGYKLFFPFIFIAVSSSTFCRSQEKTYYFFHPLSYGSEATFNPLSLIANGGFDELQSYWRPSTLSDIPWKNGAQNVWNNISDPLPQINKAGWNDFIFHEIIPGDLKMEDAQYFPNYTLHLLGGEMDNRKTVEWFEYYGYPLPVLWAITSTMSYHFINEIIENGPGIGTNVDPIADLLIFDPLGMILFSFDGVCKFFSSSVYLNDWNSQPTISFSPLGIHNVGQNFVMKYPLTASGGTSLLYHFGCFGEVGLSFKANAEDAISFGVGFTSKSVNTIEYAVDALRYTINVGPRAGLYWDRNNSLMASLVASDNFHGLVLLNIYPGVFFIRSFSPGLFVSAGRSGEFAVGLSASFLPLGVSAH